MLFGPKASVRTNLTIAVLATVIISWVIGSGVANYYNYLSFRSLRQEMIKRPDLYARPIPEPKFGLTEFFTGRPPLPNRTMPFNPGPPHSRMPGPNMPPIDNNNRPPADIFSPSIALQGLLVRLTVALGLATLAGAWLGRKYTKPLSQLARGASAFQSGNFDYRISTTSENEFAAVSVAMNDMARQVSEQINRMESDAQRRRQLLADIAHELRSPVTTMETMAGALKDGLAEEPERRDFAIAALVTTSQRLRRLVQDLMELAKLDLAELPLNLAQADLRELIATTIQSHEIEAAAAGITLHPLAPGESVKVFVDPDRIVQVLNNILENAIDYAGDGTEVHIVLKYANPIQIIVSDTGKGICASDMPYVLDPFYRADSARTPIDCHSGLGLSIANKLIEAHKGTLTVNSEEGKGTTVTITLPNTVIQTTSCNKSLTPQ